MDSFLTTRNFNWSLCIFCQKVTRNKTTCPGASKRLDVGSGYKTLSDNVNGFKKIGALPSGLNLNLWNEGDGIEETCKRHNACWHKQCRSMLHVTALDRFSSTDIRATATPLTEQNLSEITPDDDYETPVKLARTTRSSSGFVETAFSTLCFLCEKEGKDNKRKVMTKSISDKIRSCAEILKNHVLIAKLAQRMNDLIAFGAQYHPECLITIYKQASHVQTSPVQLDSEVSQVRVNSE